MSEAKKEVTVEENVKEEAVASAPVGLQEPPVSLTTDESTQELSKLETWVSDADPHRQEWLAYGELSAKAEADTLDRFQAYLDSAVMLRKLMVTAVGELGDAYSRPTFVTKASHVQMAKGVSADLSSTQAINIKLMAWGMQAMLRGSIVDNHAAPVPIRSLPVDNPPADFYGGNLNKSVFLAMRPLFRSSSKGKAKGVDVFEYKDPLYEKFARELIAGIRSCTVPASERIVTQMVADHMKSVAAYREKQANRFRSPAEVSAAEERKLAAEKKKRIDSGMSRILTACDSLLKTTQEGGAGLSSGTLRDKLVDQKIIPPVSKDDFAACLASPDAKAPVVQAIATHGLTDQEAAVLLDGKANREAIMKRLAAIMSHQDALFLGEYLKERYTTDPSAAGVIRALVSTTKPVWKPAESQLAASQSRSTQAAHAGNGVQAASMN